MDDQAIDDMLLKINDTSTIFKKEDLRMQINDFINHLLIHDFNRLVQILYRVDVNEQKLKTLLQQNSDRDASVLITDLLIQRQEEKLKSRQAFKKNTDIPEDEKW